MYKKTLTLIIFISFLSLVTLSCKKTADQVKGKQEIDRSLPGFYDINFSTIFTQKDNHLPNDQLVKTQISNYFTNIWDVKNLSGGLLVARGNNILFEKYIGEADRERHVKVASTTPMHVASVSKVLTSLAILKLVEANKLGLNEKVQSLLPSFPYLNITVKDLLTHRSGLPNYAYVVDNLKAWDKGKYMANTDVLNLFDTHKPPLQAQPDTNFAYSNTNFALLALIVEKITNTPFPEAMDKMIFKPLGMNHSYIFQEKDLSTAIPSYYPTGLPYKFDHLDLVYGDKNMYTTPENLFRLSQAMYAPNFLRADLLNLMFTPYSNEKPGVRNYGLGIRMMIFNNGKKVTFHNGWWHGSNAVFVHLIDEKVSIIAIGNKYSRAVYSAFKLISLFGDYPVHLADPDYNEADSIDILRSVSQKTDSTTMRNKTKLKSSKTK